MFAPSFPRARNTDVKIGWCPTGRSVVLISGSTTVIIMELGGP